MFLRGNFDFINYKLIHGDIILTFIITDRFLNCYLRSFSIYYINLKIFGIILKYIKIRCIIKLVNFIFFTNFINKFYYIYKKYLIIYIFFVVFARLLIILKNRFNQSSNFITS